MDFLKRPLTEYEKYVALTGITHAGAPVPKKQKRTKTKSKKLTIEQVDFETVKQVDYTEVSGKDIVGGSFTRVVIIGDYFVLRYINSWPTISRIKPYFIYKDKLSISEIFLKFEDHAFLKGSSSILIIFMFSPHSFVTYEKYKLPTCIGEHPPIEFVREVNIQKCQPKYFEMIAKAMSDTKEKFECNGCLSVMFSYFPEFDFYHSMKDTFLWSRDNVQNCSCRCFNLGKECRNFTTHLKKGIPFANSYIYNAGLNAINGNVLEFSPLGISFEDGHFKNRDNFAFGKNDVLVLDSLVTKFVFINDPPFMSLVPTKIQDKINSCMRGMRSRVVGKRTSHRILIVGDEWLNFIMNELPVLGKWKPFFRCENYLTFEDIYKIITSFIQENEAGIILTHVPSGELFALNHTLSCKDHEPLEFPVPKEELLKNTIAFGQKLINKMDYFYNVVENSRKRCMILFMTGYPTHFASYYDLLSKKHLESFPKEEYHLNQNDLINKNPAYYDTMVAQCLAEVNGYIYSRNAFYDIETCDVFDLLLSQPEFTLTQEIIFPLYPLPRGCVGLSPIGRSLFIYIDSYVKNLVVQSNGNKFNFILSSERKKKKRETRMIEQQAMQNYCSSEPLAEEVVDFETMNKTYNKNKNKKGSPSNIGNIYGAGVMTPAGRSTSWKLVDKGNFRQSEQEKANRQFMEYEQEYCYEQDYSFEREDSPEYQGAKNDYNTKNNDEYTNQIQGKGPFGQSDDIEDCLSEPDEPQKDRYESYPGIDSSGYNYSKRTFYKSRNNSWLRNQQNLVTSQDSTRDLHSNFTVQHNVTQNVWLKNSTQQDLNKKDQTTKFPQTNIKNTKTDYPTYQISSLNEPSNISSLQECARDATIGSRTAQNFTRASGNFTKNTQNLNRDSQNVIKDSQNVTRYSQNVTRDSQNVIRDSQNVIRDSQNVTRYSPNVTRDSQNVIRDSQNVPRDLQNLTRDTGKMTRLTENLTTESNLSRDTQNLIRDSGHLTRNTQSEVAYQTSSKNVNVRSNVSSSYNFPQTSHTNYPVQQNYSKNLSTDNVYSLNTETNLPTQNQYARKPPRDFHFQQGIMEGSPIHKPISMQSDLRNHYSSPRYPQTTYHDSQNSSSPLYTTYLVEPSYIASPQATYIVGQNIPRNQEVTYVPSQTFSRSYLGAYQNESPSASNTQSNQGYYTMW